RLAEQHRPKLIIAGGSAYPRAIDFERFRAIADKVGAFFLVDMAHFAALVVAGVHPHPFPYAHVVTTTTTKTLRGARGALILTNNADLAKKIDSALFPGLQGSVHLHIVTAKAVCLGEALRPEFRVYAKRVLDNARTLASSLMEHGLNIATDGTDTPLVLVDVGTKGVTGEVAEQGLEAAGITCNKNPFPFDVKNPRKWSGIRLGVSACTTRGFGTEQFKYVGQLISQVLDDLAANPEGDDAVLSDIRAEARQLCQQFPIYS
ncbi:MAG: serine hydroxymethyltransferase, partial [Gammaproteobacteria bacterium]|nr:serine hydroxymethyltransferase [Gammaproteobacteria bacterium]